MSDEYQYDYAALHPEATYNRDSRERKARTTLAVLREHFAGRDLHTLRVLDIGASTGYIDNYLANHFKEVIGIDIDAQAIAFASEQFSSTPNLRFMIGDAMALEFADQSFDIVLCSHIYEHVPQPGRMLREIERVLRPGGACYFAAGNRLALREPHYNLLFLSILPKFLAHRYLRMLGRGQFYYETHMTYWGLKRLVGRLKIIDYTAAMLQDPSRYHIDYLLSPASARHKIACWVVRHVYWLCPGYVWLLQKS